MTSLSDHPLAVVTEIYIEALLSMRSGLTRFGRAWDKGEIDDQVAWLAWFGVEYAVRHTGISPLKE